MEEFVSIYPQTNLQFGNRFKIAKLKSHSILTFLTVNHSNGLVYPDFESDWLQMSAQNDNIAYLEVQHNLGQVPDLVDVLVKSQSEPNMGFVFKGIGR